MDRLTPLLIVFAAVWALLFGGLLLIQSAFGTLVEPPPNTVNARSLIVITIIAVVTTLAFGHDIIHRELFGGDRAEDPTSEVPASPET